MKEIGKTKYRDLLALANEELEHERTTAAVERVQEKLVELKAARLVLDKLQKQFDEFLDSEIDDDF